jgi:hypothetical protein
MDMNTLVSAEEKNKAKQLWEAMKPRLGYVAIMTTTVNFIGNIINQRKVSVLQI